MYQTAKGIFISVPVLGYSVRVPPSISLCRFSLSLSLRTCVPLLRIVRFRRPSIPREIQTTRSVFRFLSFSLLIISTFLFRFSPLFGFPLVLSFFPSFDFLRRIVRRGRTQFCSSKLAVIVQLYNKPTLMVKACPCRRCARCSS